MQLKKIAFDDTKAFSPFFLDYIHQHQDLKPFYHRFPSLENFKEQITEKSNQFPQHQRNTLVDVINAQYAQSSGAVDETVKRNIESLKQPTTFTVTTGHQLNIFTGPLYFIYKIVTVINACKLLNKQYPQYHFVPVYWMASEDHDYDEIKSFRLYGKKYVWQTSQKGAVGRFHTKELAALLNDLPGDVSLFRNAYENHERLSDAVRYYVNALFGNEGVVVLDPDQRDLKSLFKDVMRSDVVENTTAGLVGATNQALEQLNHKAQVYCRDINFFYLDEGIRSRLEKHDGRYHVVDTSLSFSDAELTRLIETQPEKFSPNVILRPLYQEMILPNLAYVGGPAEVIYWLQLKRVFDHYRVPFPILLPRNFALVIEHQILRKYEKTGLSLDHLFEEKFFLFNHWVLKNSRHDLTVGAERTQISQIFNLLQARAASIDKTLGPFVGAEGKRALNSLEKIERKILRAEKRLHQDKLRQIELVKDALFPNGNLQERTDNFLNFYQQDSQFIAKLIEHFNPFDFNFNVLIYSAS